MVPGDGPVARWLPWLGILARRDDSMGNPLGNRFVEFACVISPVSGDRHNVLIGRNLLRQLRQHGRITDVAGGDLERSNLQRFFIDTDVYLSPDTSMHLPSTEAARFVYLQANVGFAGSNEPQLDQIS